MRYTGRNKLFPVQAVTGGVPVASGTYVGMKWNGSRDPMLDNHVTAASRPLFGGVKAFEDLFDSVSVFERDSKPVGKSARKEKADVLCVEATT